MDHLALFQKERSRLFAIAYRMLGSVADAEDMVQEAFLRWRQTSSDIRSPKVYLSTIITRLCIDHLRSAKVQREQYVGTWLPEPLITSPTDDPAALAELAESLSIAFLVLLERLSPTERAVFLLREVFDYEYSEIGAIVDKSATNCRQILRRARQQLASRPVCSQVTQPQQEQIAEQFLQAWVNGDLQSLLNLMVEDIMFSADGGGKTIAALKPLHGCKKVAHFLLAIRRSQVLPSFTSRLAIINGQLSIINRIDENLHSVFMFEITHDNQIQTVFAIVNPEKLRWVREAV
jgi:RNA polymerase sigma-70 factor, ECF subfamily